MKLYSIGHTNIGKRVTNLGSSNQRAQASINPKSILVCTKLCHELLHFFLDAKKLQKTGNQHQSKSYFGRAVPKHKQVRSKLSLSLFAVNFILINH